MHPVDSEEFMTTFHAMLTRIVNEYDDMAQMAFINKANELLDIMNDN